MYIHVIAIFVFDPKIVLSLLENKFRLIIAKIEMKKRWIKKGGVKCTKIQREKSWRGKAKLCEDKTVST